MTMRWMIGAAALGLWAGTVQAGPLPMAAAVTGGSGAVESVQFYYGDQPQPRRGYAPPPADDGFYDPPPPRRGYYPQPAPRGYASPQRPDYPTSQPRYGYRPEPMPAPGYPPGYYGGGSRKEAMKDYVKGQKEAQKEAQKDRVRAWNRQHGF